MCECQPWKILLSRTFQQQSFWSRFYISGALAPGPAPAERRLTCAAPLFLPRSAPCRCCQRCRSRRLCWGSNDGAARAESGRSIQSGGEFRIRALPVCLSDPRSSCFHNGHAFVLTALSLPPRSHMVILRFWCSTVSTLKPGKWKFQMNVRCKKRVHRSVWTELDSMTFN